MNILDYIDYLVFECGYSVEEAEETAYQATRNDMVGCSEDE